MIRTLAGGRRLGPQRIRDRPLGRGETLREALWNRPPWADGLLARRVLAVALTVVAVILLLRGDPDTHRVTVVVATRDLPPGHLLSAADLRLVDRESGALPGGAVRDPAPLIGATLTGAMSTGEILTDLRVIGPRLAAVAGGGPDARIVPIRLADTAVADILRAGDRVDVIAADESDRASRPARTLATDAAVVLISGSPGSGPAKSADRVVLVAMGAEHAAAVAAASLSTALTVVFH
ncbi:flagella basal body P-ring formation protein FlgA [Nocardia cyriacigeorgica]|uniref:SAF domain-containing protein n=1 Tax=Nocardia cyriacigeorgica TaxID=135487 RepID=UPI0018942E92|nr:SAF domain-containing protein [Nocardia cyriacigeorgica]MBF6395002.1 flagella basal body P-ring formation protein FlgA [Nocardia cyriacigeorgica]MBF6400635.1 flagella basal body P-ring formation protein FlgA [Nocardia cyriacigeorgica]